MQEFKFKVQKYCSETDSYNYKTKLSNKPDLKKIYSNAKKIYKNTVFMEKLKTLIIIKGKTTVHINLKGDVVINGVKTEEEASKILRSLLCQKK